MIIKQLLDEDFVNYKKPSMFIGFPHCSWKCEKDCGKRGICQNSALALSQDIFVEKQYLIDRYLNNHITQAIVIGGLEPMDDYLQLYDFISSFREVCEDDIVIYTGYRIEEILEYICALQKYKNIIIKFGRYVPNSQPIYNTVLGVTLASDNQYALKLGD